MKYALLDNGLSDENRSDWGDVLGEDVTFGMETVLVGGVGEGHGHSLWRDVTEATLLRDGVVQVVVGGDQTSALVEVTSI